MRQAVAVLAVFAALLATGSVALAAGPAYAGWGGLRPGPYAVGFQPILARDQSRTFDSPRDADGAPNQREVARPVQILVWYPASPAAEAAHVPFADYVALSAREIDFGPLDDAARAAKLEAFVALPAAQGIPADTVRALLAAPTAAIAAAPRAEGTFPLVLYAAGLSGSAFENSILCEYLASHGYVVAAVPSIGAEGRAMTPDMIGAEAQTRDMAFALATLRDYPYADARDVAVVGYSFGGLADVMLATRDARVAALVSLDGSILHLDAAERADARLDPNRLRVPSLFFVGAGSERPDFDPAFFRALKYSDARLLRLPRMEHRDFTSQHVVLFELLPADQRGTRGGDPRLGFETAAQYARRFLDATLKGNAEARAFIDGSPDGLGLPAGFARLESRRAVPAPPTEGQFLDLLERGGVQRAREALRKVKLVDPQWQVFREATMEALGRALLAENRVAEAAEAFRLNVEAYPDSADAAASLGEALARAGKAKEAEEAYRSALVLLRRDERTPAAYKEQFRRRLLDAIAKLK
ncbi:MAG: alpha/beta hydrolase [Candidatus Polarisedimenticolia bacterium]